MEGQTNGLWRNIGWIKWTDLSLSRYILSLHKSWTPMFSYLALVTGHLEYIFNHFCISEQCYLKKWKHELSSKLRVFEHVLRSLYPIRESDKRQYPSRKYHRLLDILKSSKKRALSCIRFAVLFYLSVCCTYKLGCIHCTWKYSLQILNIFWHWMLFILCSN